MNGNHQQQQNRPVLRSLNNMHSSYVRFINKTRFNVGAYWIDYQGKTVCYKILASRDFLDINTFVTHPWIFIDEDTKDRYLANGEEVFFPEPWFAKYRHLQRSELPLRLERTHVHITLPLFSLRDLCLRQIKRWLRYDREALSLEIPGILQRELFYRHPRKPDPPDPKP